MHGLQFLAAVKSAATNAGPMIERNETSGESSIEGRAMGRHALLALTIVWENVGVDGKIWDCTKHSHAV
jgi:hypothetical protein